MAEPRSGRSAWVWLIGGALVVSALARADDENPYRAYPRYYNAVKAALKGEVPKEKALEAFDKVLTKRFTEEGDRVPRKEVEELFCLRKALEVFFQADAAHREMLLLLLANPQWCGRFVYALEPDDKLDGALGVLEQLRTVDAREFERRFECCIAFALVWDDFHGHWWVDKHTPLPENAMLDLYRFMLEHERKMVHRPGKLPYELGVYVVGSRLSAEEREWVLQNYNKGKLRDAYKIYKSVPWTLNDAVTLSHGHGKGLGTPYTLMNIKKIGGCCMDQAYFTENVYRLFGVPAVYTRGRGKRGGHAWAGVLYQKPKIHWDFTAGRYDSDHYFKGEVPDPTNMRRVEVGADGVRRLAGVTDSEVKMSAALLQDAGSLAKIQEGHYYLAAARWVAEHLPETIDEEKGMERADLVRRLLIKSLKASCYNARTWHYLATLGQEKKMSADRAFFWSRKIVEMTAEAYPDFTVDCIPGFLASMDSNEKKLTVYEKLYEVLEKERVDLACEVKIWEADAWMAEGKVARAIYAYVYPLANFAEDEHVLQKARSGLAAIGEDVENEKDLLKAYWRIVKVGKKEDDARTSQRILNLAYASLAKIYRRRGDDKKAAELERRIQEVDSRGR